MKGIATENDSFAMENDTFVIIESDGLVVTEMTERAAREISRWQYGKPYELYDFTGDEEEVAEIMNGYHMAVYDSREYYEKAAGPDRPEDLPRPFGFIAIGPSAQLQSRLAFSKYRKSDATDVALGLRPELCGRGEGLGERLLGAAVNLCLQEFPEDPVRLTVARSNKRALRLYEKFEFVKMTSLASPVKIGGRQRVKFFYVLQK